MNNENIKPGREMLFGRHKGVKIETEVIRYPDYACWVLDNLHGESNRWLCWYIENLIKQFDEKPFSHAVCTGKREGKPCPLPVTRLTLYRNSSSPQFWCADCNPEDYSLNRGMITEVCGYRESLFQVCVEVGTWRAQRSLIDSMARAKGLTGNKTDAACLKFFYG
jgi:hypothetical protein